MKRRRFLRSAIASVAGLVGLGVAGREAKAAGVMSKTPACELLRVSIEYVPDATRFDGESLWMTCRTQTGNQPSKYSARPFAVPEELRPAMSRRFPATTPGYRIVGNEPLRDTPDALKITCPPL